MNPNSFSNLCRTMERTDKQVNNTKAEKIRSDYIRPANDLLMFCLSMSISLALFYLSVLFR